MSDSDQKESKKILHRKKHKNSRLGEYIRILFCQIGPELKQCNLNLQLFKRVATKGPS